MGRHELWGSNVPPRPRCKKCMVVTLKGCCFFLKMQYTAILLLKTKSFLFIWTDEGDLKYHNEVISDVTGVVVSGPITTRKPTLMMTLTLTLKQGPAQRITFISKNQPVPGFIKHFGC